MHIKLKKRIVSSFLLGMIMLFSTNHPTMQSEPIASHYDSLPNLTPYLIGSGITCAAWVASNLIANYFTLPAEPLVACITFAGPVTNTEVFAMQLMEVYNNPVFEGALLIVNSPGGIPGQSEILFHLIDNIAEKKPIVVCVIDCCCSGAYLFASAATKIVAPALSDIGCIGVLGYMVKEFPETYTNQDGTKGSIEVHSFAAGKYKSIHNPHVSLSQEDKDHIQESTDMFYDSLCRLIAHGRGLDLTRKNEWADGIVFSGAQAYDLHLVDYLGGINEAIKVLKLEMAKRGIPSEHIRMVTFN